MKNACRRILILIIALVVLVVAAGLLLRLDLLLVGRNAYVEFPVDEIPAEWLEALRSLAPERVGDYLEEGEKSSLEEARLFRVAANKAVVVLQWHHRFGDSVDGSQMRVELQRNDANWDVVWAGERWRCRPFRGSAPGWTKRLCP